MENFGGLNVILTKKVFPFNYNDCHYNNPFIIVRNVSTFVELDNAIKML